MTHQHVSEDMRIIRELTHSTDFGEAFDDAEHEFGVAVWIIRQADAESIHHHVEHGLCEQWFRKFAQVVFHQT